MPLHVLELYALVFRIGTCILYLLFDIVSPYSSSLRSVGQYPNHDV